MKTENFVSHPQNNNDMFCLQKLKDFKISDGIGRSGEKDNFLTRVWRIKSRMVEKMAI